MNRSIKPIRVEGNIAYIPLTKGYEAIIDAEDVPLVEGRPWYAAVKRKRTGEVRTVYADFKNDRERGTMHREILRLSDDLLEVDHIDGNGLNNRKKNLRIVTKSQNMMNQRISLRNKSGYKGVSWWAKRQTWVAQISIGRVGKHLGCFETPEEAAEAYARASNELHGEHGRLR